MREKKPLTSEQKAANEEWDKFASKFPEPGKGRGKDVVWMLRDMGYTDEQQIVELGMRILMSKMRLKTLGGYSL